MKTLVLGLLAVLLIVGVSFATLPTYESITVADSSIGLTATIYQNNQVTKVTCTLETAQIRYRIDGTAPTTAEGHILESGQSICLGKCSFSDNSISALAQITNFRAIRTGDTSGVLKCSFE